MQSKNDSVKGQARHGVQAQNKTLCSVVDLSIQHESWYLCFFLYLIYLTGFRIIPLILSMV